MEAAHALARLTLQDVLDAAAGKHPADVVIKVKQFGSDGIWGAGAVMLDDSGALVICP